MTMRVPELYRAFSALSRSCIRIAQRRGLRRGQEIRIVSRRGEIRSRLETRGRNKVPTGLVSCPSSTRASSSTR